MEVKDALTIMIGFSSLIITLLALVVTVVLAILSQKK
ncbi:putative holin-like toxin [Paenibacillus senegalimassiliensis]|nr:putative holin-like toxin [Paenibacillus senegalimassiliensis]